MKVILYQRKTWKASTKKFLMKRRKVQMIRKVKFGTAAAAFTVALLFYLYPAVVEKISLEGRCRSSAY